MDIPSAFGQRGWWRGSLCLHDSIVRQEGEIIGKTGNEGMRRGGEQGDADRVFARKRVNC